VNWNLEVDIVCTGPGAAGLATAISAVDLGGEAFVATLSSATPRAAGAPIATPRAAGTPTAVGAPIATHAERLYPWLLSDVSDTETNDYLAALSPDLGGFRRGGWEPDVPICVVHDPPAESARTVTPFVGARLRDWAARCLASPYGFLHTRVAEWGTSTMHTADGEMIEVAEIGSMAPDFDNVSGSVLDWLTAQAGDRDIEIHPNFSLQRIVFEEGEAIGAVFATPGGPLAVHARHGVTVATGSPVNTPSPHQLSDGTADLRVGVVSRHASRFGRLELLASEPIARRAPSTCRPCSRQVRANLRETRGQSPARRCAQGDGYPSPGR
jgi:hypothetical protein